MHLRQDARFALSLRALPWRAALFVWRARMHARRSGDRFSLASAARPAELATLLALAGARDRVVELGTGTAWTAIVLALAHPTRRVVSYDPCVRLERDRYLDLAGPRVRAQIELRAQPDSDGPRSGDHAVEMLFIDSQHERSAVLAAFTAWSGVLDPDAVVVFHDYGHPDYPGVREAVVELGLGGRESSGLYVWEAARLA